MNAIGQPHFTKPAAAYTVMDSVDIQVDNGFPTPLKFVFKVARRR
jgi:hypothetical protein